MKKGTRKKKAAGEPWPNETELEWLYKGCLVALCLMLVSMLAVYAYEIRAFDTDPDRPLGVWPEEGTPGLAAAVGQAFPPGTFEGQR